MASTRQNISIHINDRDVLLADTDKYDDPRPNRLEIPIGAGASHGWFLMLKSDADAVLAAGTVDVTFKQSNTIGDITETVLRNMIVKSVEDFGAGGFDADTQVSLVEITDVRWIWQRRSSFQGQFNVPLRDGDVDPGGSGEGYEQNSLNNGEQYTWEEMLTEIWDAMAIDTYGPWPGRFTGQGTEPLSTPYDWKFQGVNAWQAIITILARIGKVIVYDPVSENFPFAVYDMGSTSPATTAAISALDPPLNVQFGGFGELSIKPEEVSVFSPTQTAPSKTVDGPPFGDEELYAKRWPSRDLGNVITRQIDTGSGGGILNVWSDMPDLNLGANTAQVETAADEIIAGVTGDISIGPLRQRLAGFAYVPLDATLKSLVFSYSVSLLSETGGAFTSFAAHPGEPTVGLYSRQRFLWWVDRLSPPSVQQYLKPSLPQINLVHHYLGETVDAINKNSSGDVRVLVGIGGSEPDPPETRSAVNLFADLEAEKRVVVLMYTRGGIGDLIIAGEC